MNEDQILIAMVLFVLICCLGPGWLLGMLILIGFLAAFFAVLALLANTSTIYRAIVRWYNT